LAYYANGTRPAQTNGRKNKHNLTEQTPLPVATLKPKLATGKLLPFFQKSPQVPNAAVESP
jgi:hypothetical protein